MAKEGQEVKTKAKRFYEPKCPVTCGVYEWQIDEDGHHLFVKTGEKNFDDEIQLYKDQCDIKILVDKLVKGDPAIIAQLNAPKAYGDVNDYPEEYHVAAGSMALHQLYENQPDQVKEKFPTYEMFENYFMSLTDAMVKDLTAPKVEEEKKEEVVNEQ